MMRWFKNFFSTRYFIILTYLISLLCWYFQTQVPAIIYSALAIVLIILCDAPRISIVTIIFAGIITYRNTSYETNFWPILLGGVFVLPISVFDLLRRKASFKNPLFIALVIYFLANILSLVNLTKEYFMYGIIGVLQSFSYCYLYFYLWNYKEKGNQKAVAEAVAYMSVAIIIQMLIFIATYDGAVLGKKIALGWSASNSLAMVFLLLFPLTVYLFLEKEKWYLLLILGLDIAALVLTLCKGAYLTMAILLVPLLFYVSANIKNKNLFKKGLFVLIGATAIIIGILFSISGIRQGIIDYLRQMRERGWFNDKARIEIYRYGAEIFKKYPVFGSGSYTAKPYLIEKGYSPDLKHYHNFVIQNLATLGLCGLLAFGNFIIQIFRKASNRSIYNTAVIFAALAMLIHGLVDNTWHNPIIMIIMIVYLAFVEERKLTAGRF